MQDLSLSTLGRICSQHKGSYEVELGADLLPAEITGHLRYCARQVSDLPVVGDWVRIKNPKQSLEQSLEKSLGDKGQGRLLITEVLPRRSLLQRKVAGQRYEEQPIAANVDCAFLLQSSPLNLNRLERYIRLCGASKINCCLVLSKMDLLSDEEQQEQLRLCRERFPALSCLQISVRSAQGLDELRAQLEAKPKQSYCLLGSSGAGKSSLLNALLGEERIVTAGLTRFRQGKEKGRHTTTERMLVSLDGFDSVTFIDTPGMRELGLVEFGSLDGPIEGSEGRAGDDASEGAGEEVGEGLCGENELIENAARLCKFADCSHSAEPACAVREAVSEGRITEAALANYFKLKREVAYYQTSKQERHQQYREQGRLYRKMQKQKREKY